VTCLRLRAISLFLAGCAVGAAFALVSWPQSSGAAPVRHQAAPAIVPACAQPIYSGDGNFWPLFCKIDDPLALRFYKPLFPHLFALGRDASPADVAAALRLDRRQRHATDPELCNGYALWQWRWHWKFGFSPTDDVIGGVNACG
jgi:hypothetical protein